MPPKAKITRDMIIEAGLQIVRTEGTESLNVRRAAAELDCSTQPVMYHFKTVSDLKAAVYERANDLHTAYILTPDAEAADPFLSVGLRYIRFAAEEPHLSGADAVGRADAGSRAALRNSRSDRNAGAGDFRHSVCLCPRRGKSDRKQRDPL